MANKRNDRFGRYTTEWIPVRLLLVHPVVQRATFSESWARRIAKFFDPDKFGVLECVPVGGRSKKFHVFDGQHRLYAARLYLGADQLVPCHVYADLTVEMQADKFIGMYVNERTLDYGDDGRRAVRELLRRGHEAGLVPDVGDIDFID